MYKSTTVYTPIITGDIIGSQRVMAEDRPRLVSALEGAADALRQAGTISTSMDIFRGDSYQIVLQDPVLITDAAILLRIWFRSTPLTQDGILDTRLGLGLGPVEFASDSQSLSDGTAFRYAAETLEEAYSDKLGRIHFKSQSPDLDKHLNAVLIAIEPVISGLTTAQSQSLWWSVQGHTHKEIAARLDVAQSTVTRSLQSAHDKHIKYVMRYMKELIQNYIDR